MRGKQLPIHIEWEGPYRISNEPSHIESVSELRGPADYGVYQIYGGHPVYGSSALLYIGMASAQEFGKRIPQGERWSYNRDAGRVEVYVGRLAGRETPDEETWDLQIRLAERILIHTHMPPMNVQKNLGSLTSDLRHVHVCNWNRRRDLLPEVSGLYWASLDEDFPNYHAFGEE